MHKISIGTTRNSWSSSRLSGLTTGFSSVGINMGHFDVSSANPYLYYVGKTKDFLGSPTTFSQNSGFLMKMTTAAGTYD